MNAKRTRYRNDLQFRQQCIVRAKQRHARLKNDPLYIELRGMRNQIWQLREKITARLDEIEAFEKKLLLYTARRDILALTLRQQRPQDSSVIFPTMTYPITGKPKSDSVNSKSRPGERR